MMKSALAFSTVVMPALTAGALNRTERDGDWEGPWAPENTGLTGWVDYQFSVVCATAKLRF